mgnify:CR=1 FL=1
MSKLPSLSYREVAAKLKHAGFVYIRTGKHDVYVNKERNITIPLPRHSGDMPKGTLRAIIREAGFTVDDFLSL